MALSSGTRIWDSGLEDFRTGGPGSPAGAGGFPVSCRLMVAVSAARLKVVAIERFARHWRSTLTRFAATAGWRLSG
ncbi:hypothetical protein, partial [Nocardiopsis oceani]